MTRRQQQRYCCRAERNHPFIRESFKLRKFYSRDMHTDCFRYSYRDASRSSNEKNQVCASERYWQFDIV